MRVQKYKWQLTLDSAVQTEKCRRAKKLTLNWSVCAPRYHKHPQNTTKITSAPALICGISTRASVVVKRAGGAEDAARGAPRNALKPPRRGVIVQGVDAKAVLANKKHKRSSFSYRASVFPRGRLRVQLLSSLPINTSNADPDSVSPLSTSFLAAVSLQVRRRRRQDGGGGQRCSGEYWAPALARALAKGPWCIYCFDMHTKEIACVLVDTVSMLNKSGGTVSPALL